MSILLNRSKWKSFLTIQKNCIFRISLALILLLGFTVNVLGDHRQPKKLSKHLLKLEVELLTRTKEAEDILYKSGATYEDAELLAYLDSIGRKVIPPDFKDEKVNISFKVIRDPTVNAFALPTGTIYLHTGLLSRLDNEAQLAFLLGHEISHVVNKDGVYGTQSMHSKTVSTKLFDMVLAPAAVFFGLLGDLVRSGFGLLYISSVTGYSKRQEARSDKESIKFAAKAGYPTEEGPKIIEILMEERDRYKSYEEIYFLMNHPSNKRRKKIMNKLIEKEYQDITGGTTNREAFFEHIAHVKLYNASLNIKLDRLQHAMDDVSSVLGIRPEDPEAHFYAAEVYREMAADRKKLKYELSSKQWSKINKKVDKAAQIENWRQKALDEYEIALKQDAGYFEVFRGRGLLFWDMNKPDDACVNLNKYVELDQNAQDKRYVNSLIKRIKKSLSEE